jgi:hypothetical protein
MFAPGGARTSNPPAEPGMSATGPDTEKPRCSRHPDVMLTVHPRRWGWVCPRCRAAGQWMPQPYPFIPFPPLRPDRSIAPDLEVRLVSHPVRVPSFTRESTSQSQQGSRVFAGQTAPQATPGPASVSLTATVRGSSPWRRTRSPPVRSAPQASSRSPSGRSCRPGTRIGRSRVPRPAPPGWSSRSAATPSRPGRR